MKNRDLTKLLNIGDRVYSPLLGECAVYEITNGEPDLIKVQKKSGGIRLFTFNSDGRYLDFPDAECLLFPSKEIRTWEGYKPSIPDKALVWAWDDDRETRRIMGFYDAENKCLFRITGFRDGATFRNYEQYKGKEPGWAIEARKELED